MPSEKFYPNLDFENAPGQVLEVAWSKDGDYDKVFVMGLGTGPTGETLMSFDLDRGDLNRLIKSLRRARNAVYGSDE